ncbi:hypothetical protein N0V88_005494 [Collariella sp. IMI 366227]|nr:hypothetical protein N0V88_005494 [Collariella sp. IMI 366227]
MAPKADPIFLYGFCFQTQKKQIFNQQWACAFHTSWYTNEQHPMWDSIDDPSKRREVRYGNNIAVLFYALLHLRKFYGQDSLWAAVARGFNTSATVARKTAEILTEARREHRGRPSKDTSETAHAADDWINFLDSRPTHPRGGSNPEVFKAAEEFFKTQDKRMLNAARVPANSRHAGINTSINTSRLLSRGSWEEPNMSPGLPPSLSVKLESPRDGLHSDKFRPMPPARKRSASPPTGDRSPKFRRSDQNGRDRPPRPDPEREKALDHAPMIWTTTSPRRSSNVQSTQLPPTESASTRSVQTASSAQPGQSAKPAQSAQATPSHAPPSRPAQTAKPAETVKPTPQASSAMPPPGAPAARQETPKAAAPTQAGPDISELKAHIASLEKQLAASQAKTAVPPSSTTGTSRPPSQLREDIEGMKRDMATVMNATSTMMESMHDIVDSLNSLQDEFPPPPKLKTPQLRKEGQRHGYRSVPPPDLRFLTRRTDIPDKDAVDCCELTALPAELIAAILSYISPVDLCHISATCRTLYKHATDEHIWQAFVQDHVPGQRITSPYPCASFRELYGAHDPRWFLPKYKIWFSDVGLPGRLIFIRYDQPEIPMSTSIIGRLKSTFIHTRHIPDFERDDPSRHAWPPISMRPILSPCLVRGVGRDLSPMPIRQGDTALTRNQLCMRTFRIRKCMQLPFSTHSTTMDELGFRFGPLSAPAMELLTESGGASMGSIATVPVDGGDGTERMLVSLCEEISTYATLEEEWYTPTREKPWRGIWVGDYGAHGCEFLWVRQDDDEVTMEVPVEGEGEGERVYRGKLEAIKLTGDANVPRDSYTDGELMLISHDRLAHHWKTLGHISYYQRVDLDRFLLP